MFNPHITEFVKSSYDKREVTTPEWTHLDIKCVMAVLFAAIIFDGYGTSAADSGRTNAICIDLQEKNLR